MANAKAQADDLEYFSPPFPALEFDRMIDNARPPVIRSIRDFAEAEIIIPDGPFKGERWRVDSQPYAGIFFDLVASNNWSRFMCVGPTQSGKSLTAFIIPALYFLFELEETVILGQPSLDMAADKWNQDLKPVIERSRFAEYMPTSGAGSRGGKTMSIQFTNGATLRFMSGAGGDKSRAGFTGRVVMLTEIDGMDESGGS